MLGVDDDGVGMMKRDDESMGKWIENGWNSLNYNLFLF